MATQDTDSDWRTEAPLLAAMEVKNPFIAPAGYFDGLAEIIEARVVSGSINTANTELTVPENYFNELSRDIETRIGTERIKQQITADGFTVAGTYFEDLQSDILAKTVYKQPLIRKLNPNWMRYAAAACITLAVGTGFYLNRPAGNTYQEQISSLSDAEIIHYLQEHPTEVSDNQLTDIDPVVLDTDLTENMN